MKGLLDLLKFKKQKAFWVEKGKIKTYVSVEYSQNFPFVGSIINLQGFTDETKTQSKGIRCKWFVSTDFGLFSEDLAKVQSSCQASDNQNSSTIMIF